MDSVTSIGQQTQAQKTDSGTKLTSDFNAFLKMLTTQLQNQDPLKPMDATQFTQQLVTFSQVEQQIQQTGKLQAILDRMATSDLANATGFVGREVELYVPEAPLTPEGASWTYELAIASQSTALEIYDADGRKVRTLTGSTAAGAHSLAWDGKSDDGEALPEGTYTLKVTALSAAGEKLETSAHGRGLVDSAGLVAGAPVLNIGDMTVPIAVLRKAGPKSS